MSIKTVTKPPILDETGQDIVEALNDIKESVKPTNVVIEISTSLPSNGWSVNAPYEYLWTNSNVTDECSVVVMFADGADDAPVVCLEYEKVAGGVKFTIDAVPSYSIPVVVTILNAKADFVVDDIDPTLIETNQVPDASNVDEALGVLHARTAKLEETVADNAGSHNAIYRGKYLGTSVSADQWAAIRNGTFTDLFIGDYWTINGVNWRIAAFDYWLNNAGSLSTHHVVIVPDTNLATCKMNSSNITTGAYVGSDFYTGNNNNTGRATAIAAVNSAFGSNNILTYKDYLANSVTAAAPYYENGQVWQDCTVELMNEQMVYGSNVFHNVQHGGSDSVPSNYTVSKSQLPLFQHDHGRIGNRARWWLRSVVSGAYFAFVYSSSACNNTYASLDYGVRPAFGIK